MTTPGGAALTSRARAPRPECGVEWKAQSGRCLPADLEDAHAAGAQGRRVHRCGRAPGHLSWGMSTRRSGHVCTICGAKWSPKGHKKSRDWQSEPLPGLAEAPGAAGAPEAPNGGPDGSNRPEG